MTRQEKIDWLDAECLKQRSCKSCLHNEMCNRLGVWEAYTDEDLDQGIIDFSTEEIQIKYHADIPKLTKIEQGDWIDLYSAEDISLSYGDYAVISLGVSMKLPEGYEAYVAPRSSTFKNWGVIMVNGIGIIDNSYSGDNDIWKFPVICMKNFTTINKGDKICQFRIQKKQPNLMFKEVDHLSDVDRGGFGSTGK